MPNKPTPIIVAFSDWLEYKFQNRQPEGHFRDDSRTNCSRCPGGCSVSFVTVVGSGYRYSTLNETLNDGQY